MKEITLTFEISDNVYDYLVGLNALDSVYLGLSFPLSFETSVSTRVRVLLSNHLARYLHNDKESYCMALSEMGKGAELEDVLERYPALSMELGDDGTTLETPSLKEEAETVSNTEEASGPASGHAEEEPGEEAETVSNTEEASGPASGHAEEEPGKEPETVSNAEEMLGPASGHAEEASEDSGEAPSKPAGLLMEDRTDSYVYYLEHGRWPPDSDGERKNEAA